MGDRQFPLLRGRWSDHLRLEHEPPTRPQVSCRVAEQFDLLLLRSENEDRVEPDEGERELAAQ